MVNVLLSMEKGFQMGFQGVFNIWKNCYRALALARSSPSGFWVFRSEV